MPLPAKKIHRYESVSSTNDLAKLIARKGDPEGTIILAREQTRGRGRRNRGWISPKDEGIWLSIILRPKINPQEAAWVTLMAAVAVVKSLRNYLRLEAVIKRPNDVLIKDKKIAGILVEMEIVKNEIKFMVIGIGLNTNLNLNNLPWDLRNVVTSVKQEFRGEFSQEELMNELIIEVDFFYSIFKQKGLLAIKEEGEKYSII